MRFALIGDIHSNIYALCSVLADVDKRDTDFIICTGDLVGYSPFPNEVISILRRNRVLTVQGNYDKAIGNSEFICGCDYKDEKMIEIAALSVAYTNKKINDKNRQYLRNLPNNLRIECGGFKILVVHGSPRRINEPILENSPEAFEIMQEISENILLCGHTHIPYHAIINGKHIINSGTVGKPVNGNPDATYIIVDITGKKVSTEIIQVKYNVDEAAEAIKEEKDLPCEISEMIRKGISLL